MLPDCHVVSLMTNFYITFSATEMAEFDFVLSENDIIDNLNNNKPVQVKYNASTVKDFTLFFSDMLKRHFKITDPKERLQICALNGIVIDPLVI